VAAGVVGAGDVSGVGGEVRPPAGPEEAVPGDADPGLAVLGDVVLGDAGEPHAEHASAAAARRTAPARAPRTGRPSGRLIVPIVPPRPALPATGAGYVPT
jgi:hypothetical protein